MAFFSFLCCFWLGLARPYFIHELFSIDLPPMNRRWKGLSLILTIVVLTLWTSIDDCPGMSLPGGPTVHGCDCLPETSIDDSFWG